MSVHSEIRMTQTDLQNFMVSDHFYKSAVISKNKHNPFLSNIEFRVEAFGNLALILYNRRLNLNLNQFYK